MTENLGVPIHARLNETQTAQTLEKLATTLAEAARRTHTLEAEVNHAEYAAAKTHGNKKHKIIYYKTARIDQE